MIPNTLGSVPKKKLEKPPAKQHKNRTSIHRPPKKMTEPRKSINLSGN